MALDTVAKPVQHVRPVPDAEWLSTGDAAQRLDLTTNGVRWLVRVGRLTCEWTQSGRRLFRVDVVEQMKASRDAEQRQPRAEQLATRRRRMARATWVPRQPRLRLMG